MEQDPYRFEEDDADALASAQEAMQEERDEIDAMLSFDGTDLTDEKVAIAEAVGFALPWWEEENDVPTLDIASHVANDVCGLYQFTQKLIEHGYPEHAMQGTLTLDGVSGPIVAGALSVLGTIHPHLREAIIPILVQVKEARPEATVEEAKAFDIAQDAAARQWAAEQGIPVISLDEVAEEIIKAEEARRDAGLN